MPHGQSRWRVQRAGPDSRHVKKKNDVYEKCPVRMCVATSSLRFEWFVQSPGECLVAQLLEHNVILGARARNIGILLCQKSDCWLF